MICKHEMGIFFQFPSEVIINNISLFKVQVFFFTYLLVFEVPPDGGTVTTEN